MLRLARVAPRAVLLLVVAVASCNDVDSTLTTGREPPPTSIVVRPPAFLGAIACGDVDGTLSRYQATLLDVTDGLDTATALPSSPVVSCRQEVSFHSVEPGHLYIAQINAYNQLDARQKSKGGTVVVDSNGTVVAPAWTTSCWGYDGADYGLGGAGGEGGASSALQRGVLSLYDTEVVIGGCEPLSGDVADDLTGISVELSHALAGLTCGGETGQISRFRIALPSAGKQDGDGGASMGGLGGMGGAGPTPLEEYACDETVVRTGLTPGQRFTFRIEAFERDDAMPSYSSGCLAHIREGVITKATCDPLAPIN